MPPQDHRRSGEEHGDPEEPFAGDCLVLLLIGRPLVSPPVTTSTLGPSQHLFFSLQVSPSISSLLICWKAEKKLDFVSQVSFFIHPFSFSPLFLLTSTSCCSMEKFLHENCCLMLTGLHQRHPHPLQHLLLGCSLTCTPLLLIKPQPPNATATAMSVVNQEKQRSCSLGGVEFPAAPSERRPLAPLMWSQRGWPARPTAATATMFVFACHCREVV